jgi:hypothetical protein
MCPNMYISKRWHSSVQALVCVSIGAWLLVFIFTMLPGMLPAQTMGEDFNALKIWQLPDNAVALTELKTEQDLLMYKDKVFTGWAFERYPEGQLLRASQYRNGLQHGPGYLWYPDGTPQMSASYVSGALHGRFLGWYANGNVIYDMYINRGTYAKDNLSDEDDSRASSETEITEGEGSDNDNTPE